MKPQGFENRRTCALSILPTVPGTQDLERFALRLIRWLKREEVVQDILGVQRVAVALDGL